VEALVQIIGSSRSGQDPELLRHAAAVLTSICSGSCADIRQRAAAAGAVEALVQLIRSSSQDQAVLGWALLALGGICSGHSADTRQRTAAAGAVEVLVQVIHWQQQPGPSSA
jgi:hypothetical protein